MIREEYFSTDYLKLSFPQIKRNLGNFPKLLCSWDAQLQTSLCIKRSQNPNIAFVQGYAKWNIDRCMDR